VSLIPQTRKRRVERGGKGKATARMKVMKKEKMEKERT
jgi:hypothetical protein